MYDGWIANCTADFWEEKLQFNHKASGREISLLHAVGGRHYRCVGCENVDYLCVVVLLHVDKVCAGCQKVFCILLPVVECITCITVECITLVKIEKIKYLGISRYKVELRFWLDLNSEVSCGTNSKWDICWIWICSWLKSPHHSGFRLPFNSAFRVSFPRNGLYSILLHVVECITFECITLECNTVFFYM